MKVWVARDTGKEGYICAYETKPKRTVGEMFAVDGDVECMFDGEFEFSPKEFKKRFLFTPRKGSCKQMELSLTEIVE